MNSYDLILTDDRAGKLNPCGWEHSSEPEKITPETLRANLLRGNKPFFLLRVNGELFSANAGAICSASKSNYQIIGSCPELTPSDLGDPAFKKIYGVTYPLYGGSMANGISSEDFVIALGKAGFMGSFGAGGCLPKRIESAIDRIKTELKGKPFLFNLLNSPFEPALEAQTTALYLKHGIQAIEASAYLALTPNLVWYRLKGLSQLPDGSIQCANRIIAKVSRKEVALRFLQPAEPNIVNQLLAEGKITEEQARLSQFVPMADDITVEADSGGHTDNRPLVSILPAIIHLRNTIQEKYHFAQQTRIGAAGGIATPSSALAAFVMGTAYIATGSVNQGCSEAGTSEHSKHLLAQMDITDVAMAPASDMFEMGVRVQVLKRGTMFAMRGQRLFEVYQKYQSIDEIPASEKEKLETTLFKQSLESVWDECIKFFTERDPKQIDRALQNPKDKMALVFRWYLGLSSRWAMVGEKGREMDYQIWCGPAMGAFNDWVKGTYLESPESRSTADISLHILTGAAYLWRVRMLELNGLQFSNAIGHYTPSERLL